MAAFRSSRLACRLPLAHYPSRCGAGIARTRKLCEQVADARPPADRSRYQPHRRRRGGRAPGKRREGACRECARCRREPHRRADRRRRPPAHSCRRRRRGHDAGRPVACGRAPRHVEARRRGSRCHRYARLPRRGAAFDRRRSAACDRFPPRQRTARLVDRGGRRREVGTAARGARRGHARRGARSVLRHAGAIEVSQARPHRGGSRARSRAPSRHEPPRCRFHARRRRTSRR